jgi:uncharacterized GH25 family protein
MRILTLTFLAAALTLVAGDTTTLTIHVTNQAGKPVSNASVIVKFVEGSIVKLNKSHKEWELRTSEEGIAKIPPLPQGKILVQVIAKNYQTFGDTFEIRVDEKVVDIVLNPPQKQYSVHEAPH